MSQLVYGLGRMRTVYLGALAILFCPLWATSAFAYEDQASLDINVGYGYASKTAIPNDNIFAGISGSYGLGDTWTTRAAVSYSHSLSGATMNSILGLGELYYMLDVLAVVPYGGLGIDVWGRFLSKDSNATAGAHAVIGLDYLPTNHLALGVVVRPTWFLDGTVLVTSVAQVSFLFDL